MPAIKQQAMPLGKNPTVMAIAGLDPSGGAGVQADIQTLSSLQCHCAPIITTLTVQDSSHLYQSQAVDDDLLHQQLRTIASELPISAIKIGALGNVLNVNKVAKFIQSIKKKNPHLHVILDPVFKASRGGLLSDRELRRALVSNLIPLCTLITPNAPELDMLITEESHPSNIHELINLGSAILVTGGHSHNKNQGIIENCLLTGSGDQFKQHSWRINAIDGEYRGTGCTLSSAIAGFMAHDFSLTEAIERAQEFVTHSLVNAYSLESGTRIPQRVTTYKQ